MKNTIPKTIINLSSILTEHEFKTWMDNFTTKQLYKIAAKRSRLRRKQILLTLF